MAAPVKSPNGKLSAQLSGKTLTVSYHQQKVLEIVDVVEAGKPLTFVRAVHDDYQMLTGKRLHCSNQANEYRQGALVLRMYNDGIAFRYEGKVTAQPAYRIPEGTRRWMQQWCESYEGFFPLATTYKVSPVPSFSGISKSAEGWNNRWGYPALLEESNAFVLISEANIEHGQAASCLINDGELFRVVPASPSSFQNTGEKGHTPWRIAIIGQLKDVVESTLVTDVSAPSMIADPSWIEPGVASWIYWAYNHGSNDYDIVKQYVDLAWALHLPYVLIDAEWDTMKGKTIEDAVVYANAKGVKPLIWYNSSIGWVDGAPTPKFRLNKPADCEREFAWCEKIGVAGVKIDFFSGDNQRNMDFQLELLERAARHHLLVNFHGATIPRGWQRTWPNLMTTEGVYGAEWYNNVATFTDKAACHNATLPFTRNVIGPMDYTPCAFSDSQHPHITTHAHELALTVLFESALQHLADRPESFLSQPQEVRQFFGTLPTVWDDTRLISGYPGEYVVMARRHGGTWYVAGINGKDVPQTLDLSSLTSYLSPLTSHLSPLTSPKITLFADGHPWAISHPTQFPKQICCQPRGGFVMVICDEKDEKQMLDMEQTINELYNRMSQQSRIAQLRSMYMDELFDEAGRLDTAKCRQLIPYGIGHFSQFAMQKPRSPQTLRDRAAAIQDWLVHHTPDGIPALLHEEVLTGVNTVGATIYPQQIGQACSFNPMLAELKTRQTSTFMRKMGGVLSLSPMVDVCRVPSFNRLEESFGEDGYLSAVMGTAFVRGLQQGDLTKGVGACSKHYLGYGGGGDADEKELMEEILLPHETMIRVAGSKAVMPGYHAVHGTKCVANSEILKDILRDYLGFDGMVVSDYTAINQLYDLPDAVHKAAAAINGGNDVDFPEGADYRHLQEALDKGLVQPEAFERAVKNVLRYKYRAGLFSEDAYLYSKEPISCDSPEERQTAYDIAVQSVVLLENNGVLPLKKVNNVLLTGPNANSIWAMCGDYTYPAMSYFWKKMDYTSAEPHIVRLLEGMQHRKPANINVMYSRGCDWTEEIETKFSELGDERAWEYDILHRKVDAGELADEDEALRMAREADVIVAAMGENVMLCGENRDRQGLHLPGKQAQYVEKLIQTGKPVILVLFGGRAQVVSGLAERCAAVIQAWYPGEEGGHAVADILYGHVSPSAKLSVSYPNTEVYESLCYNRSVTPDPRVQWPFGYGLSYTRFAYKNLKVESKTQTTAPYVDLSFDVRNTGSVAADEIAQVYLSPKGDNPMLRPIQLQGFARVSLQPGETKKVSVRLYTDQFGYYSHEGGKRQWNIIPGTFTVKVGSSSQDIRLQASVTLTGSPVGKPLRDHYFANISIQ